MFDANVGGICNGAVQLKRLKLFLFQSRLQVIGPVITKPTRTQAHIDLGIMHQCTVGHLVLTSQLQRIFVGYSCGAGGLGRVDPIAQRKNALRQFGDIGATGSGICGRRRCAATGKENKTDQRYQIRKTTNFPAPFSSADRLRADATAREMACRAGDKSAAFTDAWGIPTHAIRISTITQRAVQSDYLSYALLGILSICFGASFYFNVYALQSFPPLGAGAGRLIIAAMFMVPVAMLAGHGLPKTRALWGWAAVLGATTYAIPFYLIAWVQTQLPSNVTALYFISIPLLLLLLSRLFLGVIITWRKGLGLAIGCGGLVYLSGPGTLSQIGGEGSFWPQIAMIIVCVLLAGSAIIVRLVPKSSPIQINAAAMLVAGLLSLPVLLVDLPETTPRMSAVLGLIGVGVVSTAIGQFLRFTIIRRRGPVFLAPNGFLATVVAIVLGVALLGEALTWETWVAFGIIFAGLIVAQDGSGNMKKL